MALLDASVAGLLLLLCRPHSDCRLRALPLYLCGT